MGTQGHLMGSHESRIGHLRKSTILHRTFP
jgi:hypothetical protein